MAKWSRRSYWLVVNGVRTHYDLSLREARASYRRIAAALGRSVFGVDLVRHPRIVAREVRLARLAFIRADVGTALEDFRVPPVVPPRGAAPLVEFEEDFYEEIEDEYDEYELTATTKGETPRRRE